MPKLNDFIPFLTEVRRLGPDRLTAACPCPGHQGDGRLKAGIRKDGNLTLLCEAGCDPKAIAGALLERVTAASGNPVPSPSASSMPEVDTTIPGGLPNPRPHSDLGQEPSIGPRDAIRAVRQVKRGQGRTMSYETAAGIAKVIREEFMRTQIRIVFTAYKSFVLADGQVMSLTPSDVALRRFLQGRFGVLADDHDVRSAIALLADQIPPGESPVPLRAANYLDIKEWVFYVPARDKILTINIQGEVGSTTNGQGVLFLPKANCGDWPAPEELPAFGKALALLHCCGFTDRPGASYSDQLTVTLAWLLAALLQAAVRPVPTLVVAGDPETALAVAETLASLIARTGLRGSSPTSQSRAEDLFGSGPAVILDFRHHRSLPVWLPNVLVGAAAGYNARTMDPMSPEAPVASTYPIVLTCGSSADAAHLHRESIIITVGKGGGDAVREAAEPRSLLYWELVGLVREVLPAVAREGGGQPIPFDRFLGIVDHVLGGDPARPPSLDRLRPQQRRAPATRTDEDFLAAIQSWLRDGRNVGRVLLVKDLLPELQATSKRLEQEFPCPNVLSLAQRLRYMRPLLTERLGFFRKSGRSGFLRVGFQRVG